MIRRFFSSLIGKALCAVCGSVAILLLIGWFLGSFAFVDYYEQQKKSLLTDAYRAVCREVDDWESPTATLERFRSEHAISALVWQHHTVLYTTDIHVGPTMRLPSDIDLPNGRYRVVTHATQDDMLMLYGRSRSGINILLGISTADVNQNAAGAMRVWWWIAVGLLLLGGITFVLITWWLARPASRLSHMAKRMAHLDFSERYTGHGQDELAALGEHLNTVAESMEQSLSELKTANAHLQNDMERTNLQNEARNRFIRNVSHELKTPIALIQTYAEGLHENIADDAASREFYCSVIEDEAQKLSQIIVKLTTLMQLESGNEELSIERFDITEMLTRLQQRYAPLFAERHLDLPSLPSTPCFVWGDGLLIEQVVTNYLTNALHHVSENGRITLTAARGDETTRIAVYNTGSTIPEDDLPHIFESFYKVDKARTRTYGGTGIGLSVVAAIMQAHGMPYGVCNLPDGVEFYVELQNG